MKSKKFFVAVALAGVAAAAISGCSSPASTTTGVPQSSKASITIWTDPGARADAAKAYASAHPELHAKVVAVSAAAGDNASRIALAKKAKKAVPDVVFLGSPSDLANMVANPVNYPLALDGVVGKSVLNGFADGSTNACTYGGKVYCLPNDLAQTVLYYNKALFDKFGYTVPTTFDEWLDLGKQLGKDHPGYSLGSVSGRYGLDGYYGSSECQFNESKEPTKVTIDTSSDACTRVNAVVGPLLANGTLSTLDPFSPQMSQIVKSGKLLATISPAWMADFSIKGSSPAKGQWAVAPMPMWAGATENYSGGVGGGIWVVSATSKNQAAAIKFAEAMSTDQSIQVKSTTYPADKKAATAWLAKVSADDWYASDPSQVYADAAGKISPTQGNVRYEVQLEDSFNNTILKSGGTGIDDALTQLGTQATQAAQSTGYTVSK